MAFDVDYGKKVRIPFSFVDASGNAAKVDGLPVVSTTLGEVAVEATDSGFAALLNIGGVGAASVSGWADVDLGEGVKELAFALGDFNGLPSPEASAIVVGTPITE
jgi:hypothetical protein